MSSDARISLQAQMSRSEAIHRVSQVLGQAGIDNAPRDARVLVAAAVGCSALALISHPEAPIGNSGAERLREMTLQRAANKPVSRILGEREFYSRPFEVTPATLDPRPDSETVIEAALELVAAEGIRPEDLKVLDIGTGSGCLIVTLLAELPGAQGTATDICKAALSVAERNAMRHNVSDRIAFVQADALDGITGRYNLIVSNPPYIPSSVIAGLEPDVRGYDPHGALDGGLDGLDIYRRIAGGLAQILGADQNTPDRAGWAVFEVGAGQASSLQAILTASGFHNTRTFLDLSGHTRCVAVRSRG